MPVAPREEIGSGRRARRWRSARPAGWDDAGGGSDGGLDGSESPRSTAFGRAEDQALAEVDPDDHATPRGYAEALSGAIDRQVTANAHDKPAYEDTAAWSRHAEERRDLLDARAKLEAAPVVSRAQNAAAVMDGVVPGARPGEVQVARVGPPEDDPLGGVFGLGFE